MRRRAMIMRQIADWMTRKFGPDQRAEAAADRHPQGLSGVRRGMDLLEPPKWSGGWIDAQPCYMTYLEYV